MNDMRKWSKPELIVLVRAKPEEAVLELCKFIRVSGDGSGSSNAQCLNLCMVSCMADGES